MADESRDATRVLQQLVYSLDDNCRMSGLIYKNKIMTIRLCLSEQINDGDLPGEKHDFAVRAVPSDLDGQFDASHLRH
jgi:5-formyltetrahydrofolate cyclo-ligase